MTHPVAEPPAPAATPPAPTIGVTIDARGHRCPVPTLRLRKALEAADGGLVTVLADDPLARIDIPHFCAVNGYDLVVLVAEDGGTVRAVVRGGR